MTKRKCGDVCLDFEGMDVGIHCERPEGHRGLHRSRYEWSDTGGMVPEKLKGDLSNKSAAAVDQQEGS